MRAHLEEDAAKTVHVGGAEGRIHGAERSLVDFNRAGTPLVEIVTAPDLRSPEQAKRFLQLLRQTVVELGISDAEMEKGSLRFDVNVSVRPEGSDELRTRTELKNMNSFNFAAKGIEREIRRQVEIYESGRRGRCRRRCTSTRATRRRRRCARRRRRRTTATSRSRTSCRSSRTASWSSACAATFRSRRRRGSAGSRRRSASRSPRASSRASATASTRGFRGERQAVANVVMNELAATGVDPDAVNAEELGKVIERRDEIPRAAFTEALAASASPDFAADRYLGEAAIADVSELDPVIDRILGENEQQVGRVPRRQGGPARLLRRPGDEGDGGQGEPEGRQRAPAREAERLAARQGRTHP